MQSPASKSLQRTLIAVAVATSASVANAQQLEEVVVTATKRSESLQEVPIAVTAMNQREIEQAGIVNIEGIALRTPGFSMGAYSAAQPLLFIRGIGSNERGAGGGETSVAMFVDNVYMNRASGQGTEMFDLESIEVLRGPQGTLWGKNATAGVINVKTRRPNTEELELSAQATVGNEGIFSANALVSGPLGDAVAGKVTVGVRERDEYMESVFSSAGDTGDLDSKTIRGQLLIDASDNLEALITADYTKDERGGIGVNAQLLDNASPTSEPANYFASLQPNIDYHETLLEKAGDQEIESYGFSLQLDYNIGDMVLTSISAYRKNKSDLNNNILGTTLQSFPILEVTSPTEEDNDMFSQELRLSGSTDTITWHTGVYYFTEETDRIEQGDFLLGPLAPDALNVPDFLIGATLVDSADQEGETDSYAAFGELTWSVTEKLDLTLGARYTYEEKDYSSVGIGQAQLFVGNYDISTDENWDNPTYKAVANYHVNDDSMVYLSVASGFKSGGWRSLAITEVAAETPFDEETVVNYELGFKTMWLDNSLRLNGAIFQTDYDDLQVSGNIRTDGCTICPVATINAGEAEINGLELEATWAITEEFQLMGNYAYLDSEYDDLPGNLAQYNGNDLRNAPENAYNLVALYETQLPGGGEISARYEYIYKDETEQEIQNWDQSRKDDYDISNFRLGYTTQDGDWEFAGWVKNAFDEEYLAHSFYNIGLGAFKQPALPRTNGMTVTWPNL